MRFILITLASAVLVFSAPASKTWENVTRLTAGAPIEVVSSDRSEKGEFVSSSTESLTIHTRGSDQKFLRSDVLRVLARTQSRRARNLLIGVGVGAAMGLVGDQIVGRYLRNEANPASARPVIWAVPIAVCGGIGAAFPSYPVIYKK